MKKERPENFQKTYKILQFSVRFLDVMDVMQYSVR